MHVLLVAAVAGFGGRVVEGTEFRVHLADAHVAGLVVFQQRPEVVAQQEQGQQWGSSWQQQNNNSLLTRQNAGNYGDQGLLAEEIDSNSQTDLTSLAYGSNVSYAI